MDWKIAAAGGSILLALAFAWAIVSAQDRAFSRGVDHGRSEMLIELSSKSEEIRKALEAADVGEGNEDEDFLWGLDHLDSIGVQLD